MNRFEGNGVLITGAGRGIGVATARRLASEGAHVLVTDIDADAAEETAASIDGAEPFPCEVGDRLFGRGSRHIRRRTLRPPRRAGQQRALRHAGHRAVRGHADELGTATWTSAGAAPSPGASTGSTGAADATPLV
ncbi:SDR family NAD(P)-dependent oxidoreductase [Streptomyces sp. NPDC018833]|uniref:SDR family NAD(P)-dependent oxidoreductase n=1 Tax=Streptomyces sp. NPDC018833 TaxID=3365053 RepID=UPI0037A4AEC5